MTPTILVVADTSSGEDFLNTVLKKEGYRTDCARHVAEALSVVRTRAPDLILADISMPSMVGYGFVKALRDNPAAVSLPVIFYTAGNIHDAAQAISEMGGVLRFLHKPAKADRIVEIIEESLCSAAIDRVGRRAAARLPAEDADAPGPDSFEEMERVARGIAHSFNNLLTAIMGSLELIDVKTRNPELHRLARNATKAAERCAQLTQQLLAVSQRQAPVPSSVDVNFLLGGFEALIARSSLPKLKLTQNLGRDLWPVTIDPAEFEWMLLKLAAHTQLGMATDVLTVCTANCPRDLAAEVPGLSPGDYVAVTLSAFTAEKPGDDAPSPRPQSGPPTGQEFESALSMVGRIAERMGGSVRLTRGGHAGGGISLYLPRAGQSDGARVEMPRTEGRAKILLVDDDPDVLTLTKAHLENSGYDVFAAPSGMIASAVLASGRLFDLLITDFSMPGLDGIELARRARRQAPQLPVLFMTGYSGPLDVRLDDMPALVIRKPFKLELFNMLVSGALDVAGPAPQSR